MHEYDDSGIFVFGFTILDVKRDALSSLPLELSWKIFSCLDVCYSFTPKLLNRLDSGIFVFGFTILDVKRDALSSLPLELSWKIFSYLDDGSLQTSCKVHKLWKNIILSCKKLRRRLNHFGLAMRLGSERLAKFHRRNRRRLKKERKRKNYLEVQEDRINIPPPIKTLTWKRKADDLVIHIKRYKLY